LPAAFVAPSVSALRGLGVQRKVASCGRTTGQRQQVVLRDKKSLKEVLREAEDPIPNEPLKNQDPEKEFELNRGLAVDTLLQDYPYLLDRAPDFSIFRKDILLQDAQGFSVQGLQAYQLFFGLLRRISYSLFSSSYVSVLLMDKYAADKSRIRLRWKISVNNILDNTAGERDAILKKMGFDKGSMTQSEFAEKDGAILEGISVYKLDAKGMIISHQIEITEPTALNAPLKSLQALIPVHKGLVTSGPVPY